MSKQETGKCAAALTLPSSPADSSHLRAMDSERSPIRRSDTGKRLSTSKFSSPFKKRDSLRVATQIRDLDISSPQLKPIDTSDMIADAASMCMKAAALLYKNRGRSVTVDLVLPTSASTAKLLNKCKKLHEAEREDESVSDERSFAEKNKHRLLRIHGLMPEYEELIQRLAIELNKTKWRRLLVSGDNNVEGRLQNLNAVLHQEAAELERLYLQHQLHQFTSMELLEKADSDIIKEDAPRSMWYNAFGQGKVVVEWLAFENAFCSFTKETVTLENVAQLRSIIDHAGTGTVTQYAFAQFITAFGPFERVLHNMMEVVESSFFFGYFSSAEAEKLLSKSLPGTFLVRFSVSPDSSFAIAYVDAEHQCRHVQILPTRKHMLRVSECKPEKKFRVSRKKYASLRELVAAYASILRNPLSSSIVKEPTFHGDMTGEEAAQFLEGKRAGSYLTRFSESVPGCLVVSYVDGQSARHALVEQIQVATAGKQLSNSIAFRFVRETKDEQPLPSFPDIKSLVSCYSSILRYPITHSNFLRAHGPHLMDSPAVAAAVRTSSPARRSSDRRRSSSGSSWDGDEAFSVTVDSADCELTEESENQVEEVDCADVVSAIFDGSPSYIAFLSLGVDLDAGAGSVCSQHATRSPSLGDVDAFLLRSMESVSADDGDDERDSDVTGDEGDRQEALTVPNGLPPSSPSSSPSSSSSSLPSTALLGVTPATAQETETRTRSLSAIRADDSSNKTVYATLLLPSGEKKHKKKGRHELEDTKQLIYAVPTMVVQCGQDEKGSDQQLCPASLQAGDGVEQDIDEELSDDDPFVLE